MTKIYTWLFPNKSATMEYQQAPQSIDAKLQTLYQQAQYIVGTNKTADLRPTLQPLPLTMFNLNVMLRKAHQRGWNLSSVDIINHQHHVTTITDVQQLTNIFDPAINWSFETWVSQLKRKGQQLKAITLSHQKALNSMIQITLPNQVSYSGINLKHFRPGWTHMVIQVQRIARNDNVIYYPMIFGDTVQFPDFAKTLKPFDTNMTPRRTRQQMQRWIYDNYTIDTLPKATQISDHALTDTDNGSYVIIRKNHLPRT